MKCKTCEHYSVLVWLDSREQVEGRGTCSKLSSFLGLLNPPVFWRGQTLEVHDDFFCKLYREKNPTD